jgi:hypothetical protein
VRSGCCHSLSRFTEAGKGRSPGCESLTPNWTVVLRFPSSGPTLGAGSLKRFSSRLTRACLSDDPLEDQPSSGSERNRQPEGGGALAPCGAGRSIVYLAEAPAAALLEVCVHTSANDVPPEFTLLKIEGPDLMCRQSKLTSCPRLADSARSDARPGNGMAGEERQRPTASSECDCS